MSAPPQATRDKIRNRLMDLSTTNPLADDFTVIDEAITQALTRYSLDRPRTVVADIAGTGSPFYPLTGGSKVLTSWQDGASSIQAIDYPAAAISATYQPTWLDNTFDWAFYQDATLIYLRFLTAQPPVGSTARVYYTAPHSHDTVTDTIPAADLDALCDLAASYACQALATKAAASQDSLISADSTNYRDSQLRFKQQADAWEASYAKRLNIRSGVAGATAVADWNRTNTVGWQWLSHNRRWR